MSAAGKTTPNRNVVIPDRESWSGSQQEGSSKPRKQWRNSGQNCSGLMPYSSSTNSIVTNGRLVEETAEANISACGSKDRCSGKAEAKAASELGKRLRATSDSTIGALKGVVPPPCFGICCSQISDSRNSISQSNGTAHTSVATVCFSES